MFWLVQNDIPHKMKTSLCFHFSLVVNLLLCLSLIHYFDQDTQNICQYNLYFLILLKMVVEICQDIFFLDMLPSDIFQNLHCALNLHLSIFIMLLFYHFIKQN